MQCKLSKFRIILHINIASDIQKIQMTGPIICIYSLFETTMQLKKKYVGKAVNSKTIITCIFEKEGNPDTTLATYTLYNLLTHQCPR
jgi:hypothetical protein